MRYRCTSDRGTGLHGNGTHVAIIRVIAIGMMQAHVDAKIDPVILRVPPACIHDLVCIGCGIDGTIRDAIIHTIVTVVIYPVAQAVGPVSSAASITYTRLRWRCSRRCRNRAILICHIACVCNDAVVKCIVRCGMIENGFLRCEPWIWRIQKWRNGLCRQRASMPSGRAAHAEEN